MKEFFKKSLFGCLDISVGLENGFLSAKVGLNGDAVVDFVIDAAEKAIPGDFDKPLLEVVRGAAKEGLRKL